MLQKLVLNEVLASAFDGSEQMMDQTSMVAFKVNPNVQVSKNSERPECSFSLSTATADREAGTNIKQ